MTEGGDVPIASFTATYTSIGVIAGLITIIGFIGTAPGRRVLSKMFRGQSIEQIASVSADQLSAAESAYNIVRDMRDNYEKENKKLRLQIDVLRRTVTGTEAIAAVARALADHDTATKAKFDEVLTKLGQVTPHADT